MDIDMIEISKALSNETRRQFPTAGRLAEFVENEL